MVGNTNKIIPYCVGMTGGIACGKSTIANLFRDLGIDIVDADIIAREAVEQGSEAFDKIVDTFGIKILTNDGALDRKKLRNIVFSDDEALKALNAIVHPFVHQKLIADINKTKSAYCIAVIPLLIEHNLMSLFDRVLVIDCPEALQIQRICKRDKSGEEIAKSILQKQVSRAKRLEYADDLIVNENTKIEILIKTVQDLNTKYTDFAKAKLL